MVAWSTLGMVIDVCSGPLAAEAWLGTISGLMSPACAGTHGEPGRPLPDLPAPSEGEASAKGETSTEVPPCLCSVTWPPSILTANFRPHGKTRGSLVSLGPALASSPASAPSRPLRSDERLPSFDDLPLQLCRLLC